MVYKPKFRQGKDRKCWCGSKRKEKNCHGRQPRSQDDSKTTPKTPPTLSINNLGLSGEDYKLWVLPIFQGEDPATKTPNFQGGLGKYKVQILLSRPGYPLWSEREHKFIDDVVGDSHLLIAKPADARGHDDVSEVWIQAANVKGNITFRGLPNEKGYLGKFIAEEFIASGFADAEARAYESLAPFLSAWSLHLDIPINVHTIQITELSTHFTTVRARTPHLDMTFGGGAGQFLSDDFCHHASVYKEGMNTNSPFYRFLCFFKIIESIQMRRSRRNAEMVSTGGAASRFHEIVPSTDSEAIEVLRQVFPWKKTFEDMPLNELFPLSVRGKRLSSVVEKFNRIRVGIAHAVLKAGEIRISIDQLAHIQEVNAWLPLCRILARWLLRNEFSQEYEFKMKDELPSGLIPQLEMMRAGTLRD